MGSSAWPCLSVCCTCLRGQEPSSETGAALPGPGPASVSSSSQRVTLMPPWGLEPWDTSSHNLQSHPILEGVQQIERDLGWARVGPGAGRGRADGTGSPLPALGSDPAWHMKTLRRRAGPTPSQGFLVWQAELCAEAAVCVPVWGVRVRVCARTGAERGEREARTGQAGCEAAQAGPALALPEGWWRLPLCPTLGALSVCPARLHARHPSRDLQSGAMPSPEVMPTRKARAPRGLGADLGAEQWPWSEARATGLSTPVHLCVGPRVAVPMVPSSAPRAPSQATQELTSGEPH